MPSLPVSILLDLFYRHSECIRRAIHDSDPGAWIISYPNNKWPISYAPSTMTGMLRGHIEKFHLVEYIEMASVPNRSWLIQVQSVKNAMDVGYSLDELKDIAVKTGSSRSGTDERGKCDNVGLSAACLSNEATIRSVVVAVA